ncbi:hypothetical protein [Methylotetracoccus oryzae]|uniref:hypothetical protein n=1 Tax=Methylotetracoccus oryzae TaxID=1919059 RepID=UPI0011195651|nr:hypothetical protein [Methylotetracoccus oryzae]
MGHRWGSRRSIALVSIILSVGASGVFAETYELPPTFDAARILPANLVKGPYHHLAAKVRNDGTMNHYTVESKFGRVTADSTAELRIRIDEMRALAAMQKVDTTEQLARQAKQGGKDALQGAKGLVTNPVGTLKGAFTGLGKVAERAGDALMGDPPSDAEDSRFENAIGFSSTKRAYAAEFRVDPYSTNPLLQKRLEEIAWWGYSGKLAASAVSAAIPGGVGAFVSASKTSNWLEGIPVQTPPSDLRKANRQKLLELGVSADATDLFLGNTVYSPVQQTKLVAALARMDGTADRGHFVKFAVLARSAQVAFFRARQAEMYANFHAKQGRIERFVPVGTNAAARLANGAILFCFPTDYLVWTDANAALASALDRHIASLSDIRGKEVQLAGGVSPRAREALQALGWKVSDGQEALAD